MNITTVVTSWLWPRARSINKGAFDPQTGSPPKPNESGFGGERRSSGMSELSPQVEARDMELAHAAGHTENAYNNRCDQLAVAESQKHQ